MAGGMGRPGANIGAGMPQARVQAPQDSAQQSASAPMLNMPAISPMQQYMQSLGINRMGYNPQAMASQSYAAPRAPQIFQPAIKPNMISSGGVANDSAKPADYQRMRDELDQLRERMYGGQSGPDGGGGNN